MMVEATGELIHDNKRLGDKAIKVIVIQSGDWKATKMGLLMTILL